MDRAKGRGGATSTRGGGGDTGARCGAAAAGRGMDGAASITGNAVLDNGGKVGPATRRGAG